jgi:hypothetical protein
MNILGQPFAPWVTEQINVRQTSLGNSTNLTNTNLISQYSKTPWLRLASTVNITEIEEGVYSKLTSYGINGELIKSDQVAKNLILFGGTSNDSGSLGIGLNSTNQLYNGAYGWGGISDGEGMTRGYVPMPGITNASVQYYNNGALSKATINMRCYSRNQLALLDVLYMRPGYNLLLEFGHTVYLNNEGELEKFDNFLSKPLSFILNPTPKSSETPTHFDVLDLIQKERKNRAGNYEGVFGKITNFNWNFNPDGSYDCSTIITGMGDMMESLKVNIKLPSKDDNDQDPNQSESPEQTNVPPIVANKDKTTFNKVLYGLYEQTSGVSETDQFWNVKIPNCPLAQCEVETSGDGGDNSQKTEFKKEELVIKKGMLSVQNVTTDEEENISPQVYITFGCLIGLIQKYLLLYNKNGAPLFDFDVDFKDIENDKNYIVKLPGSFSADPLTCLIPYSNVSTDISATVQIPDTDLNNKLKESSFEFNTYLGRLMHVYLNANKLVEIFNSAPRDNDGSLSLLSFLNNVIREFTSALGGLNMISIKVNEDKGKIVFIENSPQRFDKEQSNQSLALINTFGVKPDTQGSFVRNIVMGGEISQQFASMIAIGAQIQGNKLSANSTGFSKYNLGLVDRMIPQKNNATEFSGEEEVELTLEDLWNKQIQNPSNPTVQEPGLFVGTYQLRLFVSENISALRELNTNWINMISGKLVEKKQLQSPFFLPFNLSLDLDGISGMKLFEKFTLDDKVMPPSYGSGNVDLLVKSLNHEISPSAWLTKIDTQAAPRSKMSPITAPKPLLSTTVKQVPASSGGSRIPVGELGDYKSLTSGFPMAKIYYDGPSPKNQIYLHHTAGATKSPSKTIRSWSKRTDRVSTHYITNNLGDKEQLYADEAWGNHLGIKKSTFTKYGLPWKHLNKFSLGIEMQSYGYLTKKGDKYITAYGNAVPADTVAQPVDKNGNPISYKGKKYYQKYNSANIAHVKDIVTGWMNKYGIPFVYDYDELFPNSGDSLSKKALGGESGVYTHNSVKTGKSDVFPQKELLDMLKSIATSIKS